MPAVAGGELNSVSCTSPTACTAVGLANGGGPTGGTAGWLAERWDGTAWTVQPTSGTPDAMMANLTSVSCATSTACRAVGYYLPTSGPAPILTIAAHWNGTTWSTKTTPNPPDTLNAWLLGVSCTATTHCLAVGDWAPIKPGTIRGAARRTLAERWTTAWAIEPSPNPLGTVEAGLNDVSCPATGTCHAVGYYADHDGYHRPQAQTWNGQAWTHQPVPTPTGSPNAALQAVSCPSPNSCVAVGHSEHDGRQTAFGAHWDGTRWSTQSLPRPAGATDVQLLDVACPTPTACVAVGRWSTNGSNPTALIQRWDGSRWDIDPAAIPAAWYASWLTGVACPTTGVCVAVGGGHNSNDNNAFALLRADAGWAFDAIPTSLYRPVLTAISCPSPSDCTAVGSHSPGTGHSTGLTARWDGSQWAAQPIPKADREHDHQLAAVACTTAACTAVGQYSDAAGTTHSLVAASPDRTSWSTTFAPTDTVPRRDWLTAVSCASACIAVGRNNGANYALVTAPLATSAAAAPATTPAPQPAPPATTAGRPSSRSGYWALGADGAVYSFGDAPHLGTTTAGAVDLEPTPTGKGYWTLNKTGTVQTFGDAATFGHVNTAQLAKGEEPASLSATPSGKGYWVFTNRGRAIAFGDARYLGDVSAVKLNGPVLGSVATPSGRGYYIVASDGGIFAFGDAAFAGSMGGKKLNAPVQSLVPDSDGKGYWLVASDGGIFAFDAPFRGSMGGTRLNKPVVGMVRYGDGYLMVGADGGIFNFSSLPFSGSLGDKPPAAPVVAVAALR
jgi:hypothetical protein